MDDLTAVLMRRYGVALRRDLLAAGSSPDELHRSLRNGGLVRVRHGAYAEPATLSHVSAAIALGLPVWGVDLEHVHVTRPPRSRSRHEADVVHHNGRLPDEQVVEVAGLRATRAASTCGAWRCGCTSPSPPTPG